MPVYVDAHGAELTDPAALAPDSYFIGTPDDIVAAIRESEQRLGYEELIFWGKAARHAYRAQHRVA